MKMEPANGAVIVRPIINPPHPDGPQPHMTGYVLAKGNGVPWLWPGEMIAFDRSQCSEFYIDEMMMEDIPAPHKDPLAGNSGVPSERVYLVEQRHVLARINPEWDRVRAPRAEGRA